MAASIFDRHQSTLKFELFDWIKNETRESVIKNMPPPQKKNPKQKLTPQTLL